MTTVQMIVLLFFACLGVALWYLRPGQELMDMIQTTPMPDLAIWLRTPGPSGLPRGCVLLVGPLLACLQSLVAEPCYLIWALRTHTGNLEMALLVLVVMLAGVVEVFVWLTQRRSVTSADSRYWRWLLQVWQALYMLPTLYLWYVLVVILSGQILR